MPDLPAAHSPVLPVAPAELPAAAAPGSPGAWDEPPVPACAAPARLQPAKLAVWQQHHEQRLPLADIAATRRIQLDSAQAYVAEAIAAGLAYRWRVLGVADEVVQRAGQVATATLRPEGDGAAPEPGAPQRGGDPAAGPAGGSQVAEPRASGQAAAVGDRGQAAGSEGGAAPLGAPWAPVDLLEEVVARSGLGLRQLKDEYFPDVGWGHVRLAFAHLGRLKPHLANKRPPAPPV